MRKGGRWVGQHRGIGVKFPAERKSKGDAQVKREKRIGATHTRGIVDGEGKKRRQKLCGWCVHSQPLE